MTNENAINTVFIVAGSPMIRAGLKSILQADEQIIITGSAGGISNVPLVFSDVQTADVWLVNVETQEEFDALISFLSESSVEETSSPMAVALFATDFQTSGQVMQFLQNGGRGILPHNATADEIIAAIRTAALGLTVLPPEILETFLVTSVAPTNFNLNRQNFTGDDLIENLTARETEVLEFLVEGESNKEIANRLDISEHTVKFHVASIFGKLGAGTRTEAVTQALRRGLILL